MRHLNRYLRLTKPQPAIAAAPSPGLRLCVVIPCLNEPELPTLIERLHGQTLPDAAVEILIVINHADNAADAIKAANAETLRSIEDLRARHDALQVHAIRAFDLPAKDAGVGLARKIGMDEAMRRFAAIGRPDGIIASLDADCRVSDNYIAGLIAAFDRDPSMHAATLPFAHRLDEVQDARHRSAMTLYELFLRYVELGWRHAGLPYAFTSIGSCFAVRANACARHHGMNKRKAGEDFYFLHKLARERSLGYIPGVCVYPSARMS
ncbi:MAG: glycosyltransferase, partial [Bacteroidetes bacterium]